MNLMAFDIETWGMEAGYALQPWREKQCGILSVASCGNDGTHVTGFKPPAVDIENMIRKWDKSAVLCGWNLKFDLAFLFAKGHKHVLRKFQYLDGMLLLKRMGLDLRSYALKRTLAHFASHINYEHNYETDVEFKPGPPKKMYNEEEQAAMLKYNTQDAVYTLDLIKYLVSIAEPAIIAQALRESTAAFLFADSWQAGIHIDVESLAICADEMTKKCEGLELLCEKVGLSKQLIRSPLKLQDYIRDKLQLILTQRTPSGAYSVDSKVLKRLYFANVGYPQQVLRLILRYKEALTERSKFIESTQQCVKDSHIIHPDPILNKTYTGRLAYNMYQRVNDTHTHKNGTKIVRRVQHQIGVPIHQIKKKGAIRKMFIAPEGHKLVEMDFAAQEVRLIACIANEPTMIGLFNENKDMHAYTAAGIHNLTYEAFQAMQITNPDPYKEMRYIGKLTNLALQYRLGAKGLYRQWHDKYGLVHKTEIDAYSARSTYLRLYHGIPKYWERNIQIAKQQGYVENMSGRKIYLKKWGYEDDYKSSQTAINFPVQSTGADQKILGLHELKPLLVKSNVQLAWDLHDGLYFYVPEGPMFTEIISEMAAILSNLPYEDSWNWSPQVDFPVEVKVGDRWGDLEQVDV